MISGMKRIRRNETKGDESPQREVSDEITSLYRPCAAYRYAHALSKARFIVSNVDSVTAE